MFISNDSHLFRGFFALFVSRLSAHLRNTGFSMPGMRKI